MTNGEDERPKFKWDVDLEPIIGRCVALETTDGIMREGRVTKIIERKFMLDEVEVNIPTAVELNGDPTDHIEMTRLVKFELTD